MKHKTFSLLLLVFCWAFPASDSDAQSGATEDVIAQDVEFRGGEIRGFLKNNTSHRVRDVELRIRYFWVWTAQSRGRGRAPELSFDYTVRQEIPPRGSIPFSYETPPLPARDDGYYDIEVTVARSVNVDALGSTASAGGAARSADLKTGRDVAGIVGIEGLVIKEPLVSGVLRNKAPHAIRDVELLIRHVWVPNNEYRPGGDDPGKSAYYTVRGEIQPGDSVSFTYDSSPLPDRSDGHFQTKVAVAGFQEVGLGESQRDRDAPRVRLGKLTRAPELGRNTARVEAVVEDPSGLELVEVWLNGEKATSRELMIDARNREQIQISRTFELPRHGDNCVAIAARDLRGNSAISEEVCLYREPVANRSRQGVPRVSGQSPARTPRAPRAAPPEPSRKRAHAGAVRDTEGPSIELLQPHKGDTIAIGRVTFEATLEDVSGIETVDVWLNDEKLPSGASVSPGGRKRVTIERAIQVGRMGLNCFALSARDVRGNTSKERFCLVTRRQAAPSQTSHSVRSVSERTEARAPSVAPAPPPMANVQPPRSEDVPASPSRPPRAASASGPRPESLARARKSSRYAVIIGIGDYTDERIPDLRYAEADARAVHALLTDPSRGDFRPENVKLLVGRDANRRNVTTAVGDWLFRKARSGDAVLFYYAGYGAVEKARTGRERDGLAKYLVPSDAIPDNLFVSGISSEELSRLFSGLRTRRLAVFLDSSYAPSTKGSGRALAPKGLRRGSLSRNAYDSLSGSGRVVVGAARANQAAMESSKLRHGVFTKYFLDGLRGGADTTNDGRVTLMELYPYLSKHVPVAARAEGASQEPVLRGSIDGDLVLASVPRDIQRISMDKKIEILKRHYLERRITAKQFDRAVQTLESGKQDRMLEDFINGEISVSTFRRSF